MNIKQIVDKIIKEADINPSEYTIEDRLEDIHQTRLELQTRKRLAGMDTQTKIEQTEVLVDGDQSFAKVYKNAPIIKIEYRSTGGSEQDYICLTKRKDCVGGKCSRHFGTMAYTEDTDNVYIWQGLAGELRVTYADDTITEWVLADYTTGTAEPTELKKVFHKLLWMEQVLRHTGYYSKERYEQTRIERDALYEQFIDDVNNEVDGSFTIKTHE